MSPLFSSSILQKGERILSKEWMHKTLKKLGFTETDAQVYVFLTTEGPRKAKDIAEALNLHRQKLYETLKNLQNKAIVNASPEHPTRFSAVLFEKVLDYLIEAKTEQQKALQESKKELLTTWKSITKKDTLES
jgi:sugar-specific transcriptional regulator TrmB